MPNLGPRSFQGQDGLSNETKRRLDALQQQVDKVTPQMTIAQRAMATVREWRKSHPAAVPGGLRKG
jgi:hypothetical protein